MAIAHSQPITNYMSATRETLVAAKACSDALKAKSLRIVNKPMTKSVITDSIEITPVFVGIAG